MLSGASKQKKPSSPTVFAETWYNKPHRELTLISGSVRKYHTPLLGIEYVRYHSFLQHKNTGML